jgi:hypothetical protein
MSSSVQVDHVGTTSNSMRPESVRSKMSAAASLSGLFRRATSRKSFTSPSRSSSNDSMSIISITSTRPQSRSFPLRSLGRKSSRGSLRSEASQSQEALSAQEMDTTIRRPITPSSRRHVHNTPPSAFSTRGIRVTPRSTQTLDDVNGNHTQSVKEIRQEIEAVEAEGMRLLDAFNGLELSTLTRSQRRPPGTIPISNSSIRTDSDAMSINSGGSASMSIKLSTSGRIASPIVSQPISISRKNSISSMSSRGKSTMGSSIGRLGTGSTSSLNLSRSPGYSTLATVDEKTVPLGSPSFTTNDTVVQTLENEMMDIRKRRAEVVARYEARLELLRAKLKGAEMHEKLLKR